MVFVNEAIKMVEINVERLSVAVYVIEGTLLNTADCL